MRLSTDPYSYYILTQSRIFKYLISPTPPPAANFPDLRGEHLAFQTVPCGDWSVARLALVDDGRLVLRSTENTRFPDAGTLWHPCKMDLVDLPPRLPDSNTEDELQCYGHLGARIVRTPSHLGDCRTAIAFRLWQPSMSRDLGPEIEMYAVIHGHEIGPKFLAHITENQGRLIGFMVENLEARLAATSDLEKCSAVLKKLHNLGIAHGNLSLESFLIDDRLDRAYLHGFTCSYPTKDQGVLDAEIVSLEHMLRHSDTTAGPRQSKI
ncbi:MAG: hypothetical protein Q9227_004282 [Pyrenula ochraceoflavens]